MAISLASLNRTTALKPPRILIHGVHGVGKTTFAAGAPDPVFILTEDGLGTLEVPHFPLARTFDEVMQALAALYTEEHAFRTLVVDSVDWLEPLIHAERLQGPGLELDRGCRLRQGLRPRPRPLAAVHRGAERAARRQGHGDRPDRAHRHQALRQPRVRALRPLCHQASQQGLGAAAGALGHRAVRQLPHQHGQDATSASTRR